MEHHEDGPPPGTDTGVNDSPHMGADIDVKDGLPPEANTDGFNSGLPPTADMQSFNMDQEQTTGDWLTRLLEESAAAIRPYDKTSSSLIQRPIFSRRMG